MTIEYFQRILNLHAIDVKVHSFFGLPSFTHNKNVIAIEKESQLYLQTKDLSQREIDDFGLKSHKEFHCYLDDTFLLAEHFSQHPTRYIEAIKTIIALGKRRQNEIINQKLHLLPNLNNHIAKLLRKISITNTEAFLEIGAVDAFYFLQKKLGPDLSLRVLWRLAGAELGLRWEVLSPDHKQQLLMMLADKEQSDAREAPGPLLRAKPTLTQHVRSIKEQHLLLNVVSPSDARLNKKTSIIKPSK